MATYNAQIAVVASGGTVNYINPKTTATNVSCTSVTFNTKSCTNVQNIIDELMHVMTVRTGVISYSGNNYFNLTEGTVDNRNGIANLYIFLTGKALLSGWAQTEVASTSIKPLADTSMTVSDSFGAPTWVTISTSGKVAVQALNSNIVANSHLKIRMTYQTSTY